MRFPSMNSLRWPTNRSLSITMTVFASEHLSDTLSSSVPTPVRCPVLGVRCPVLSVRCPVLGVRCLVLGVRCLVPTCPMACPPLVRDHLCGVSRTRFSFAIVVNRTPPVQSKRLMDSLTVSVGKTAGFFIDSAFQRGMTRN